MISVHNYLAQHGTEHEFEMTEEMQMEAESLCEKVNAMLEEFGETRALRSGWRPAAVNAATPNAAHKSRHITCQAMDIEDEDGRLKAWVFGTTNEEGEYLILEKYELWAEYGAATPTWLHVQIIPPGSGKRVFFPNSTWAARAEHDRTQA